MVICCPLYDLEREGVTSGVACKGLERKLYIFEKYVVTKLNFRSPCLKFRTYDLFDSSKIVFQVKEKIITQAEG